jgi:16S rRNA G966 N2-methylase RsmD
MGVPANQQVTTPIPAKLIQAKSVFIENRSGFDRARDEFVDELGKGNRLHVVYNKTQADVVVILQAQKTQRTTQIVFVDPTTGERIWTNSMMWSERGAARDLMADLEQKIQEQEQPHN